MDIKTKYDLDQKVKTLEGTGRISMIGLTEGGTQYLVALENGAGKSWQTEAALDKENAKESAKSPASKAAAIIIAFLLSFVLGAQAQVTDGYTSTADNTTSTNYNQVVFPGVPTKIIRLLSYDVTADTNIADLHIIAGTTPYTVTGVINGTNLVVANTGGIITNQLAILQFGTTNWVMNINHTNNATNVFLALGGSLGFTPLTNSTLWVCTNRSVIRLPLGRTANAGEALAAAQVRAPLAIRLTPSLQQSNRVFATVKYGSYDAAVATQ